MSEQNISKAGFASQIYIDEGLDIFWDLRAALTYFASVKLRVAERLDAHDLVIPAYENWFSLNIDLRVKILQKLILDIPALADSSNILSLPDMWDRAEEFFPAQSLDSLPSLKSARNDAARKLHPDLGGDVDSMQKLNQTYDFLHAQMSQGYTFIQSSSRPYIDHGGNALTVELDDLPPKLKKVYRQASFRDEILAAHYFNLLVEEWSLDAAALFFGDGAKFKNLLSSHSIQSPYSLHLERFFSLCFKLDRSDICVSLASSYADPKFKTLITNASKVARNIRFRSNHRRVHDNIKRLATASISEKLLKKQISEQQPVGLEKLKFARLKRDPPFNQKQPSSVFIPHPWGGPLQLASDQCWEYHQTFYSTNNYKLIEKYLYVRTFALIEELLLNNGDPNIIANELTFLAQSFNEKWLCHASVFANFFSTLTSDAQSIRQAVLKNINAAAKEKISKSLKCHDYVEAMRLNDNFVLSLSPSSHFLKHAAAPIEFLSSLLGSSLESQVIPHHQKTSLEAVLNFRYENKPSGGILSFEQYIDACLEFAAITEHVEEFQICYYYNRLTIYLAKQQKWDDVRYRLEQLFSLPERFFQRSNKSELQSLKNRLSKSKSVLEASIKSRY